MKKSSLKTASKVALACSVILAACSTSPQGRKQITAPLPVSEAYSEADMRIQLATASSVTAPCSGVECALNQEFDRQVKSVGNRLALAAYDTYPDLIKRVSGFQFEVAEKSGAGSASNAAGKIVIYRGVQKLGFDEAGLAFVIAREMGHVIGQHHDENSGTRILLSIAAGVLFPALHLLNGSAQLAQATQATSATTLGTTVASTATSYVGSKAILAGLKPDQLSEADAIALGLLDREGWHLHDLASVLDQSVVMQSGGNWAEDFRVSLARLKQLDAQEQSLALASPAETAESAQLPATPQEPAPPPPGDQATVAEMLPTAPPDNPPAEEKPVQPIDAPVAVVIGNDPVIGNTAALAEHSSNPPLRLQATRKLRPYFVPAKKLMTGKTRPHTKRLKMTSRKKPPAAKAANARVVHQAIATKPVPPRLRVASARPKPAVARD